MIKQFNFYDIYGYLLPGLLLVFLFWLPMGLLKQSWPEQDISKALFLAVLAYIAGHVLQTIAAAAVPSTKKGRYPSELYLDATNKVFATKFKQKLEEQVKEHLGLPLNVDKDGQGTDEISNTRQRAFFQARTYLLAHKSASYAEQFQGMYVMMRGFACALFIGTFYICGWALSFYRGPVSINWASVVLAIALAAALILSVVAIILASKDKRATKESDKKTDKRAVAVRILFGCLLVASLAAGFLIAVTKSDDFWRNVPAYSQPALWALFGLLLIGATQCYSSHREFADYFVKTIWQDFSAHLSFGSSTTKPAQSTDDTGDE